MTQLVNTNCTICQERIPNELEAGFCQRCGNPVHHRCMRPMSPAPWNTCPTCGTNLALAARQTRERQQRELALQQARPRLPPDLLRDRRILQLGRYFLGAAVILFLALTLFLQGEHVAGIGAAFAAVGTVALGIFTANPRSRRNARQPRR